MCFMVGHDCDRWDKVSPELTYFCSHKNSYICYPSYFKLLDHILALLLCIKTNATLIGTLR